jgi:hypothetical protein
MAGGLGAARTLYAGRQTDIATICRTLGLSRATLYRYLKTHPVATNMALQPKPER